MRKVQTILGAAVLFALVMVGVRANAQGVQFEFRGGSWSHHFHHGWHRYWGGPSIGFYYAPAPVYVVPGYDDPYDYTGPDYWYSNPAFGLSLNFGGGGGGYYGGRGVGHYHRGGSGGYQGHGGFQGYQGGSFGGHGGGRAFAGHGGGHASGGRGGGGRGGHRH